LNDRIFPIYYFVYRCQTAIQVSGNHLLEKQYLREFLIKDSCERYVNAHGRFY
jgi:hypothetical protein